MPPTDFEEDADKAQYASVLYHYRLTPGAFAALPAHEQEWLIGYETYRRRKIGEWREALTGDGSDSKANHYSPEVATALMLAGL